jgi:hypothetical protein
LRGKQGAPRPTSPKCERPRVGRGRTCSGRAPSVRVGPRPALARCARRLSAGTLGFTRSEHSSGCRNHAEGEATIRSAALYKPAARQLWASSTGQSGYRASRSLLRCGCRPCALAGRRRSSWSRRSAFSLVSPMFTRRRSSGVPEALQIGERVYAVRLLVLAPDAIQRRPVRQQSRVRGRVPVGHEFLGERPAMGAPADNARRGLRVVENAVPTIDCRTHRSRARRGPAPGPAARAHDEPAAGVVGARRRHSDPRRINRGVRTSCK